MAADVARTNPEHGLITPQHEIDRARADLESALQDLEHAVGDLKTLRHWRAVAERSFRRRPGLYLGIAVVAGYRLGRPRNY